VKILNKKKIKQMKVKDKTYKEIHFSKMFNHPNVVKLYEFFESKEDIYVVFEYVPNRELFNYISNNGALSETEARKFFQQLIFALDYSHTLGVAHRDLKPENILLDSSNNVKLADFGLSNFMKGGRALKTSCGSPNYAAPEVISGKIYDGAQVDVWSLGVTLYAMLFGELPFDEENVNAMFKYIKEAKYYMHGTASPEAKDLINKMLQPNCFKRITIPEIIQHPWFKAEFWQIQFYGQFFLKVIKEKEVVDLEIIDQLFELKLGLNHKDREKIEEAITQGEKYDF